MTRKTALAGAIFLTSMVLSPLLMASSASAAAYHCENYPYLRNVPRFLKLFAPHSLCVARGGSQGHEYEALDVINPPHTMTLAARLHVQLLHNGNSIANSREYVTPTAPLTIATGWIHDAAGGVYCARLWNHDSLGYYIVEAHCIRT